MGKMIAGLVLVIAIEFALYLFTGSGDTTNSLFQFILDPTASGFASFGANGVVGTNAFLTAIQGVFLGFILIAGISVGTGFVFKQDSVIFATFAAFMGTFLLSIIKLWIFIYSNLGGLGNSNATVASIICAPLIIAWIIIIPDYARGRD